MRSSFAVFALALIVGSARGDDRADAIKFLISFQQADGGFIATAAPKTTTSLRATSGAVRAIKYLGGELATKDKAAKFVMSCYHADTGAFSDQPGGKSDSNTTAIGMMAAAALLPDFDYSRSVKYLAGNAKSFDERRLAVAGMESAKKFAPEIDDWFRGIAKTANADGTFGTGDDRVRSTGGIAAMYLRSGRKIPDEQRKAIIETLRAGEQLDGGFAKAGEKASDMETTYRVMRAFHLLGQKPKGVALFREFLARHHNPDGGYGTTIGGPSSVSGTYYVAVIQYWLDQK